VCLHPCILQLCKPRHQRSLLTCTPQSTRTSHARLITAQVANG
jgi:hypothetical protein